MTIKVAIACDHAGLTLKKYLVENFRDVAVEWLDLGTNSTDSVDYPDFGARLATAIERGDAVFGVAVCGSGIGISIAVNRNKAARCALVSDETSARLCREHNNANVIAFGARLIGEEIARACLVQFLTTEFVGGRHAGRVEKLSRC